MMTRAAAVMVVSMPVIIEVEMRELCGLSNERLRVLMCILGRAGDQDVSVMVVWSSRERVYGRLRRQQLSRGRVEVVCTSAADHASSWSDWFISQKRGREPRYFPPTRH